MRLVAFYSKAMPGPTGNLRRVRKRVRAHLPKQPQLQPGRPLHTPLSRVLPSLCVLGGDCVRPQPRSLHAAVRVHVSLPRRAVPTKREAKKWLQYLVCSFSHSTTMCLYLSSTDSCLQYLHGWDLGMHEGSVRENVLGRRLPTRHYVRRRILHATWTVLY